MTGNEIRETFLKYFERQGHTRVRSSPLLPANDPTLLFTNAGMNQFKDVFLGLEKRDYVRACSSQKCLRAGGKHNDLDEVGKTARHQTFFEMLGNFSFGDYFKEDAIKFAWDLLVNEYKLDPARMWFSVFEGDDQVGPDEEAEMFWEQVGAPRERILRFDRKDNFWQMGDTGPCGPCSEIHYYMGPDPADAENCAANVNGPGDTITEIWNLVFMQFDRSEVEPGKFKLEPLPAPSVDTGMGLERLAVVLQGVEAKQGVDSNYETDLIRPIIDFISATVQHVYQPHTPQGFAMRVIADHARSTAFSIADGILPGNEGRNYVIRKIMRRAIYQGRQHLFLNAPFFYKITDFVVDNMKEAYPEIESQRGFIERIVTLEETRFASALSVGLQRLDELCVASGSIVPEMSELVRLYDTFGLPRDLIRVGIESWYIHTSRSFISDRPPMPDYFTSLDQSNITIDEGKFNKNFDAALQRLQQKGATEKGEVRAKTGTVYSSIAARTARTYMITSNDDPILDTPETEIASIAIRQSALAGGRDIAVAQKPTDSEFRGYETTLVDDARVAALIKGDNEVQELREGDEGEVVLDQTPFYAESGGQVGDVGRLNNPPATAGGTDFIASVVDTYSPAQGLIVHKIKVEKGSLKVGDAVTAEVDVEKRDATRRNHTATHLMHAALREVLGTHVKQAGSVVAPTYLRFDFTHYQPLTTAEIKEIESLVNYHILRNEPVETNEMATEEAMRSGAMALFGEKYGEKVRVLSIKGAGGAEDIFSRELCGGTHVRATGDIGLFKITSDESIASGVRRIRAVTGTDAFERFRDAETILDQVTAGLRTSRTELPAQVERLQDELKKARREADDLRMKIASGAISSAANGDESREVAGVRVVAREASGLDSVGMRQLSDTLLARIKSGVVVLGRSSDGKVSLIVRTSDDLTGRVPAGKVIKELAPMVGGKGGGKADMAEGGGTQADKLGEALEASYAIVERLLS
ncbi:MAG: alanine--tRNA ligase [Pyrinomonadaceae bacterium]|nr:alanine--tRNA ligase [Pyrinomonadaceae bacterium]